MTAYREPAASRAIRKWARRIKRPRQAVPGGFVPGLGVATLVSFAARAAGAVLAAWGRGIRGCFEGPDGTSVQEFIGRRVYVTSSFGTMIQATLDVDGDMVITRGAGGGHVFRRRADTLDGGMEIVPTKPEAME